MSLSFVPPGLVDGKGQHKRKDQTKKFYDDNGDADGKDDVSVLFNGV